MKTKRSKALLLGCVFLLVCGLVFAAERPEAEDDKPDRPHVIAPNSPHKAPELVGLPHINLSNKQKAIIEEIVKNNQEGVMEVNKAVRIAEKALAQAKKAGRPKLIEIAAFELGQAIGDRAILNHSVVKSIKEVLGERQLEASQEFNAKTKWWLERGKLTAPERPDRGPEDPNDRGPRDPNEGGPQDGEGGPNP